MTPEATGRRMKQVATARKLKPEAIHGRMKPEANRMKPGEGVI
jgi:hypothetical protein